MTSSPHRISKRFVLGSLVLVAWLPAAAITGKVVDSEGQPIANASACLIVDGVPGFCTTTDENGNFDLVDTEVPRMRVSARDYQPKYLPAVTQEQPIVLRRAAWIHVRLVDSATGEPVATGKVTLTYPSGVRKGPFPVNRLGVRVGQLPEGEVVVSVKADGYRPAEGQTAKLVAGEEAAVTVELEPLEEDSGKPEGES
jgi:hypothetical protein